MARVVLIPAPVERRSESTFAAIPGQLLPAKFRKLNPDPAPIRGVWHTHDDLQSFKLSRCKRNCLRTHLNNHSQFRHSRPLFFRQVPKHTKFARGKSSFCVYSTEQRMQGLRERSRNSHIGHGRTIKDLDQPT
jgi:hypothetical protein